MKNGVIEKQFRYSKQFQSLTSAGLPLIFDGLVNWSLITSWNFLAHIISTSLYYLKRFLFSLAYNRGKPAPI